MLVACPTCSAAGGMLKQRKKSFSLPSVCKGSDLTSAPSFVGETGLGESSPEVTAMPSLSAKLSWALLSRGISSVKLQVHISVVVLFLSGHSCVWSFFTAEAFSNSLMGSSFVAPTRSVHSPAPPLCLSPFLISQPLPFAFLPWLSLF